MKTIEMDTERLELMTATRCEEVLRCYELEIPVDWDAIEMRVSMAVWELEDERRLEPFRAAGRSLKGFIKTMSSITAAFNEGFNEEVAR